MSLRASYISWLLVAILSICVAYQFIGASKAEQRAAQLEATAKDLDAQLKTFEQQSAMREAQAESRYQASLAESANLRAILAKGSQARPQNAPQSQSQPITAALEAAKGSTGPSSAATACTPFIYKGEPLVIQQFQVSVCDQKPMVQAEAAVALQDQVALVDKLNTELADADAKLVLTEKDLAAYKAAEASWKKAAKKSRVKRILGVGEKVGLFVAGVYLGHRF